VAVYLGRHLVASGLSLHAAIRRVRAQVPFAIKTPRFVPAGYMPVQLALTPRQRGVSGGLSTLTYVLARHGRASPAASNGFQISQASRAIPFVGGLRVRTATRGRFRATVREFKAPGADIVVLTWTDARGRGYSIVTPAEWSHLSTNTLLRIAASLS
jgi:hypothetical protein